MFSVENNKIDAIVTGHTLYDDSNEVILELRDLRDDFSIPVLSPLIAMEKNVVLDNCKEIGL